MKRSFVVNIVMLCLFVIDSNAFYTYITPKEMYRNRQEYKALFKKLGIEYLDRMEFEYADILQKDISQTLQNPEYYEELYTYYGTDIKYNEHAPMAVVLIDQDTGYGVFAKESIKAGDFVGVYTGVVTSRKIDHKYAWVYPSDSEPSHVRLHCDSMNAGNELRFVNHSYAPNVKMFRIIARGMWHICYIACEDIAPGEQLLVNYGRGYWSGLSRPFYSGLGRFLRIKV